LILGNTVRETSISLHPEKTHLENNVNLQIVDSIQRVSSQLSKNLPNGTKIRFDWKKVTYETKLDNINGKESTLNALAQKVCRTSKGEPASINIYRHINARYLNETGWHPLEDFRSSMSA